jgi:mannose-6-phosphate isomerase
MGTNLYPLTFTPLFKHYLWGGGNLRRLGKQFGDGQTVAESWEISDHGRDVSVAANGPLAGATLRELIGMFGEELCPPTGHGRFPLLIKYIDAAQRLSVQVHPDDEYARIHEGPTEMGKNECWYVLEAPPGAELILGMREHMTRERFRRLVEENRIEEGLARREVAAGDFIFIKTGTVHALLEGVMVCEIQQNSDTTYRIYDWGRVDRDGRPRPLHLDKALDVITFPSGEDYTRYLQDLMIPYDRRVVNRTHRMVRSRFFNIDLLVYVQDLEQGFGREHVHVLNVVRGRGTLRWNGGTLPCRTGDTVLVGRGVGDYRLETGYVTVVKSFL